MDNSIFYCPNCNKVFKVGVTGKKIKCSQCTALLYDMKISSEDYSALSKEGKESLKSIIKETATIKKIAENKSIADIPTNKPLEAQILPENESKDKEMRFPDCGNIIKANEKNCNNCGRRVYRKNYLIPVVVGEAIVIVALAVLLIIILIKNNYKTTKELEEQVNFPVVSDEEINQPITDQNKDNIENDENMNIDNNDNIDQPENGELGSRENPYSIGDLIELRNMEPFETKVESGSIRILEYNPSNYSATIEVSIGKISTNHSIRPIEDLYIMLRFVDSDFTNLDFLSGDEYISMNSDSKTTTTVKADPDYMPREPKYITVITPNGNGEETWNWVKLD